MLLARTTLTMLLFGTVTASTAEAQTSACPPDHVGCEEFDVDFEHRDRLFDEISLDTGWIPAGAPIQVRFGIFVGGQTEVDLGGTSVTSWPPALASRVLGRPGTGRLSMNYGLEIVAQIRIDVEVAGTRYTWEGDIPLPGDVPRDLRFAGDVSFDPFVLPPREPRPVTVSDETTRGTVLTVDVTDALIPIPGIGGGLLVEAEGQLEVGYQTDRIDLTDAAAPIRVEDEPAAVRPDPGRDDFGAAKDFTIVPQGTIAYLGSILLAPALFIEIAGRRFDVTLTEVELPIADVSTQTDFSPADVHVPLPDLRLEQRRVELEADVDTEAEVFLTVTNDGEATLSVNASMPSAPFRLVTSTLTLPPRASGRLPVRFEPTEAGDSMGVLLLATNDPDTPLATLQLVGRAVGPAMSDAGLTVDAGLAAPRTAGGCGCRSATATERSTAPWLVLLALVGLRRRRPPRA